MKRWKQISQATVFDNYRRVDRVDFEMPDGRVDKFYLLVEPAVVAILALTPDTQVIICNQYRPGPNVILPEIPAGIVAAGEGYHDAAARELLEETCYAGEIEYVTSFPKGTYTTLLCHCFVAVNCVKVAEQKLDDNEFIQLELISLARFRQNLRCGLLTDVGAAYQGLDYLGLL